jgi:cytochrome c oxidase assembly protein subunit 15
MDVLTRTAAGRGLSRVATRLLQSPMALRRWATASLVANVVIVVTGALVRLTSSGLGCPTWPRCTEDSYVSHPALGYHGAIEFGNRLLTFVLILIAILTWASAMAQPRDPIRPRVRTLALIMLLGVPAQAVIGGITVLTGLNPFVVAFHLLVSMILIALAVLMVRRTRGIVRQPGDARSVALVRATFVAMGVAVWLGTVVTGSGPHAGDLEAPRTGFDPALVAHVHAAAVYVAVGLTIACVWVLRSRAAVALLGIEIVQGAIGFVQYHTGLPVALVAAHLLGAAAAIALATNLLLSVRPTAAIEVAPELVNTQQRWRSAGVR